MAMKTPRYYYSTRDLLMMAAMAALGGITSTYINFIGDFFQSLLGFAGTTQWAAGLHVLWLVLAVGLTKKQGAGTLTGIIKGGVELLTGNTHGLLVVLVDIVAGILVDLGTLPFRKKDHWLSYAFAGGIASASNVFVFQLFAALPVDLIGVGLIGIIAAVAFVSGVIFAGLLGAALLAALQRAGIAPQQPPEPLGRIRLAILIITAVLLAGGLFGYLRFAWSGEGSLRVGGEVAAPYQFSSRSPGLMERTVEIDQSGMAVTYLGYPLAEVIQAAVPDPDYDTVLLSASDGYAFLISRKELADNPDIILQVQGQGKSQVYNLVGPASKKAWINGVVEVRLLQSTPLPLIFDQMVILFEPADWVSEMDSTRLDVGSGNKKYQGVPLGLLLDPGLSSGEYTQVVASNDQGQEALLSLEEVLGDDGIRIFLLLDQGVMSYALAHLDGEVYLVGVEKIEIR
jgi:ABC-type thiamin/hydroxymethylpyrimidine transport system permease subunit